MSADGCTRAHPPCTHPHPQTRQVKLFGGFVRYACDVAPPDPASSTARQLLTTIDSAFHKAVGGPSGPVHLNCNFREPLAPSGSPWPRELVSGLDRWLESDAPFTTYSGGGAGGACAFGTAPEPLLPAGGAAAALAAAVGASKRVLVVAGHLPSARDQLAVARLCAERGWPLAADVCSGLRIRGGSADVPLLAHFDLMLMERGAWGDFLPDCIIQARAPNHYPLLCGSPRPFFSRESPHHRTERLTRRIPRCPCSFRRLCLPQFGGRLVSKRLQQFLEMAALSKGAQWAFVASHPHRHDPGHAVTLRLQATAAAVTQALSASGSADTGAPSADRLCAQAEYLMLLSAADTAAGRAADTHLEEEGSDLSEMHVARIISRMLPESHALFLGNSMPVRDMDMYGSAVVSARGATAAASAPAAETGAAAALHGPDWPAGLRSSSGSSSSADGPSTSAASNGPAGSGFGVGVPIASNRGASGIDGVVSAASGFAFGLARPTTLLIGDVSFTHDTNGLLLLRRASWACTVFRRAMCSRDRSM